MAAQTCIPYGSGLYGVEKYSMPCALAQRSPQRRYRMRWTALHGFFGSAYGAVGAHNPGSVRTGTGGDGGYALSYEQIAGAGHRAAPTQSSGSIAFPRMPPRAFGSAGAGHGGGSFTPMWPLTQYLSPTVYTHNPNDPDTSLIYIPRVRWSFQCGFMVSQTASLNWGPASIGLRTSPLGIQYSSVWGHELVIGTIVGDGALFPNPEVGWGHHYKTASGGSILPDSGSLGHPWYIGITVGRCNVLRYVLLEKVGGSILKCYVNNRIIWTSGYNTFTEPTSPSAGFGIGVEGAMYTFAPAMKIEELVYGEADWPDQDELYSKLW